MLCNLGSRVWQFAVVAQKMSLEAAVCTQQISSPDCQRIDERKWNEYVRVLFLRYDVSQYVILLHGPMTIRTWSRMAHHLPMAHPFIPLSLTCVLYGGHTQDGRVTQLLVPYPYHDHLFPPTLPHPRSPLFLKSLDLCCCYCHLQSAVMIIATVTTIVPHHFYHIYHCSMCIVICRGHHSTSRTSRCCWMRKCMRTWRGVGWTSSTA